MPKIILIAIGSTAAALLVAIGVLLGIVLVSDDDNGVAEAGEAYFGAEVQVQTDGLRVSRVDGSSPASNAGIQPGDILRAFDGRVVRTPEQLKSAIEARQPGDRVTVNYDRGDRAQQATIMLGSSPSGAAGTAVANTAATSTPSPSASGTPDFSRLPNQIRDRVREAYERGELTREQVQALLQQRTSAARFGIITAIDAGSLTVQTQQAETFTTAINDKTAIRLGAQVLTAADLKVGNSVLVISMDGGATAFSIQSYGVLATP